MAKKNSTKTATKEAQQASEPRLVTYRAWKGINLNEAPLGWNAESAGESNQTDLMPSYLMVQNNADTTSTGAIETRHDTQVIIEPPAGKLFNGVTCLRGDCLICAFQDNSIMWKRIGSKADWKTIFVKNVDKTTDLSEDKVRWTSINFYQETLICLTGPQKEDDELIAGEIFTGKFNGNNPPDTIQNAKKINDPTVPVELIPRGSLTEADKDSTTESITRISVGYVYANKYGTTTANNLKWTDITVTEGPERWHSGKYLQITGEGDRTNQGITGVDLYCKLDENSDAIFIGHVDLRPNEPGWSFNWLGAMADTSVWTDVSLQLPTENTTKGVDASYMKIHDGRIYFWGGSIRYRLWIGGNPGNELSVARGVGGYFVDIEPGNDMEVKGTAKFKTYNGASIVTIMCGNPNTSRVKRYNLIETNLSISNELSAKGYMTEEVANVVGCTSHHGFGAWADGLYTINRYGVMVTTMAMESNNQLRATSVSSNIDPIFSDMKAAMLSKSHMIFIDDKIYVVMGRDVKTEDGHQGKDDVYDRLDVLILVYDVNTKCWWTYTYDKLNEVVLSLINVDSEDHWEGLGLVTPTKICMIPTTGPTSKLPPKWNPDLSFKNPKPWDGVDDIEAFDVLIETGELTARQPPQQTLYLSQLEFRFDYIIGHLDITVEGIDYYGRKRTIHKDVKVLKMERNYPVWMRIDELFETYKVTIKGKARFRMTHFIAKIYTQSNKINQVYGFVDHSYYANRHGGDTNIHHALDSYNNLRQAIIP